MSGRQTQPGPDLAILQDITLGQYAPRKSLVHALDPRTRMTVSLIFMIQALVIRSIPGLILLGAAATGLYILAKLSPVLAWKNVKPFLWLFLLTVGFHAFFTPGEIVVRLPLTGWILTREGLSAGIYYSLRILILIVIANWMTLTTSPMELTDALERLLKPFARIGVPAHEIAMMMSISLRFIPILLEEAERIRRAQVSRGASFGGSPVQKVRSVIPVVIPLFLSTFRRANDLALAMDARCYRGGEGRTSMVVLRFRRSDGIAGILILLFSAMLFGLLPMLLPELM